MQMEHERITAEGAALLGVLAALVAEANEAWYGKRQYTLEYYGGKYVWVHWRPEVLTAGWKPTTVVPKDTRTTELALSAAIGRLRDEIGEAA